MKMKRILQLLLLLPALAFGQAQGPYGIFGGPIPSASLPPATSTGGRANTYAFTADKGLMFSNGSAWTNGIQGSQVVFTGSCINANNVPTVPCLTNTLSTGGNFAEWTIFGNGTFLRSSTTCVYAGCLYDTGVGDLFYESTYTQPTWVLDMDDNTANNAGVFTVAQNVTNNVIGLIDMGIVTDASTRCGALNAGGSTAAAPDVSSHVCAGLAVGSGTTHQVALVGQVNKVNSGTNINVFDFEGNAGWLAAGFTTPVKYLQVSSTGTSQATLTLGDTNASSVTQSMPLQAIGTAFTVSGCGAAGSITGGSDAGTFTCGTGASPATLVFTINGATGQTAAHGWICVGSDQTSGITLVNTASSTTTCTLKGNVATSDVVAWAVVKGY